MQIKPSSESNRLINIFKSQYHLGLTKLFQKKGTMRKCCKLPFVASIHKQLDFFFLKYSRDCFWCYEIPSDASFIKENHIWVLLSKEFPYTSIAKSSSTLLPFPLSVPPKKYAVLFLQGCFSKHKVARVKSDIWMNPECCSDFWCIFS